MPAKKQKRVRPGKCRICGCTYFDPCQDTSSGTCGWADETQTLCDNPKCLKKAKAKGRAA